MPGVLIKYSDAPVAQRIEQRSSKPKVVGSNPAGGALVGVLRSDHNRLIKAVKNEFPHLMQSEESI